MSRTGHAGRSREVLFPDLSLFYSPTHCPQGWARPPWSHWKEGRDCVGGWGAFHGDAQLAQLVWLVLASWQRKALGTGEDVAGSTQEDRKMRKRGGSFVHQSIPVASHPRPKKPLSVPPTGTRNLTPHPHTPPSDPGVQAPSLSSLPRTHESKPPRLRFPHTLSPLGLTWWDPCPLYTPRSPNPLLPR